MCQHKHLRHKKITFRGYLTRHSGAQRPPLIYEFEVLSMKTRRLIFAAIAFLVPVVGVVAFQGSAEARLSANIERQFITQSASVCPTETEAFLSAHPKIVDVLSTRIAKNSEGSMPLFSEEHLQIVMWVGVQAAQVATVIEYTDHVSKMHQGAVEWDPDLKTKAKASTDMSNCLMPVGPRFSQADEDGIAELAHAVTKDALCAKWAEYSNQVLSLDIMALTPEEASAAHATIGDKTINTCPTFGRL